MLSRFTPLLLAPALLLSACGTYNGGMESVYQPVVQRNDYVFDVQTAGYSLAPGESQRLAGWLDSMGLRYGDHIAIDDGGNGMGARDEIAAQANRYGIMLSDQAPVTVGQIAPGTVRVVVTRMTASVPNCPDYSRVYTPDWSQSTSSNYGCATNSNLAAMVADPADLVRGASGSPLTDPATGAKAINALRGAKPSGNGGTEVKSGGNK
ncbi:CpaD family pilus assembly protein [Sphingomonas psychrotolerans]|uniref:CpaD family pilus assembly protein n=1 Tax=Sphingomonas psychrotolerans TaxID=1327635 RepID=A0ABU3N765_9SPHN|nr:CpaD family pilus assembly protein [Sphingomonas psychrotolerans]MDT8759617.1 CpaD family pilus assembly protein [Sphingomonas psychrotolerans]